MRSRIYESRVVHQRLSPKKHGFSYSLFYFAFDLDELPELHKRFTLFSLEKFNVFSFRDRDYLPTHEPIHNAPSAERKPNLPLKARVLAFAAQHGVSLPADSRVELITLPRIFGHHFNPVSFYFGYDANSEPAFAIAEVTNTFREMKPYFVPARLAVETPRIFQLRAPKHFYVSPFSDVDVAFDFTLRAPRETLAIQIDDYTNDERTLHSTLTGQSAPLSGGLLARLLFSHPLLSLKIISLIHWQAFRLWRKKVPHFPKANRPTDQRDLYRPHNSLTGSSKDA